MRALLGSTNQCGEWKPFAPWYLFFVRTSSVWWHHWASGCQSPSQLFLRNKFTSERWNPKDGGVADNFQFQTGDFQLPSRFSRSKHLCRIFWSFKVFFYCDAQCFCCAPSAGISDVCCHRTWQGFVSHPATEKNLVQNLANVTLILHIPTYSST